MKSAYDQREFPSAETQTTGNAAVRAADSDPLAPFIQIARGIPENWPDECILRFDQRADGSIYLAYHGVNDAKDGITIAQWRALVAMSDKATMISAPGRQRFHCGLGIRQIQKGRGEKPATMMIEVSNDLAGRIMKSINGVGPKVYGPVLEWEEDISG